MKKFLLPFQNMVRADLFSGSLAVWNLRGKAARNSARHPRRRRRRNAFELFPEYTANWKRASRQRIPSGAGRAARLGFERAFWAKKEKDLSRRAKEIFSLLHATGAGTIIF